jgi:hypothetical protein
MNLKKAEGRVSKKLSLPGTEKRGDIVWYSKMI